MKPTLLKGLIAITALSFLVPDASALTIEQLRNDNNLTPQTFARHFSSFKFVFRADVQAPESFLRSRAGDCDDYSTLAAAELAARGYRTRLVSVRLKNEVHVVCYVEEAGGFLDYNFRARGNGIVLCGPDLSKIADAVAKSFKSPAWTSVSEFTYSAGVKRLVATTLPKSKTKKPETQLASLATKNTRQ